MLLVFIVFSTIFLVTVVWKWHVDRVGKSQNNHNLPSSTDLTLYHLGLNDNIFKRMIIIFSVRNFLFSYDKKKQNRPNKYEKKKRKKRDERCLLLFTCSRFIQKTTTADDTIFENETTKNHKNKLGLWVDVFFYMTHLQITKCHRIGRSDVELLSRHSTSCLPFFRRVIVRLRLLFFKLDHKTRMLFNFFFVIVVWFNTHRFGRVGIVFFKTWNPYRSL